MNKSKSYQGFHLKMFLDFKIVADGSLVLPTGYNVLLSVDLHEVIGRKVAS